MEKSKNNKILFLIKRIIPIFIVFFIIMFLTTQSREDTLRLSGAMREFFKTLMHDTTSRWTYDMHWFRTLMHLPLYFLLGCVTNCSIRNIPKSAGICLLIALADETLKIFLPTREFGTVDVCFDIIGFMIGIVVSVLIRNIMKRFSERQIVIGE